MPFGEPLGKNKKKLDLFYQTNQYLTHLYATMPLTFKGFYFLAKATASYPVSVRGSHTFPTILLAES